MPAAAIRFTSPAAPPGRSQPSTGKPYRIKGHWGGEVSLPTSSVELVGDPMLPVVVVLGGISASRHVTNHAAATSPGWWSAFAGEGRALDTRCCCVLGMDYAWRGDGPIDTRDQARLLALILDRYGITQVEAIVGSSYGGMVAFAFAALFPDRVRKVVAISAAHEPHPMATALRVIQRRIIRLAQSSGQGKAGVALARALGVTTYRTADEFADRFPGRPSRGPAGLRFPVEDYLDHQGSRFANSFDEARYLNLSESIDLHQVDPSQITATVTLVAVDRDTLVPPWQMRELFAWLKGPGRFVEISSRFGHDAFLKEIEAISDVLVRAVGVQYVS